MGSLLTEQDGRLAEISGWDTDENFFVEQAVLHHGHNGNRVGLRAHLRVGSLVFVRPFDPESMDRTVPVTFRVSAVGGGKSARGSRDIEITRARPRETASRMPLQFTFRETMLN